MRGGTAAGAPFAAFARTQNESAIERVSALHARDAGGILVKLQHGIVGMPDRLLLLPRGVVAFVEFKAPNGKLTKIQSHWLGQLARLGFATFVCSSVSEFDGIVNSLTGG